MTRIAINGFGRIGRCVLRAIYERSCEQLQVVCINEMASTEAMAYLLRYDTTHGRFAAQVSHDSESISINQDRIWVTHAVDPNDCPWAEHNVDLVIECSGSFTSRAIAEQHLAAGCRRLMFSQPADPDVDFTAVYGVNHDQLGAAHKIISAGSCTSNCAVSLLSVLEDVFPMESVSVRTLHAAMNDQPIIDAYHHQDLRRNRAAFESLIPVETELAKGIARILPAIGAKTAASALRLPLSDVSAMDFDIVFSESVNLDDVKEAFVEASKTRLKGVLDVTDEPLVSCDFVHNSHSLTLDLQQLRQVSKRHYKMLAWFDNEWGYANRILDTAVHWHNNFA